MPKYVLLRDAIVAAVTGGDWPAGTRLPNETEWAASLPVSLGTIQRALRMLVDEGVVWLAGHLLAEITHKKRLSRTNCAKPATTWLKTSRFSEVFGTVAS